MGSITASCGHVLDEDSWGVDLSLMEWDNDYDNGGYIRVVSYGNYCEKCAAEYEKLGIVLHNKQEEQDWLNGKIDYPEIDYSEFREYYHTAPKKQSWWQILGIAIIKLLGWIGVK